MNDDPSPRSTARIHEPLLPHAAHNHPLPPHNHGSRTGDARPNASAGAGAGADAARRSARQSASRSSRARQANANARPVRRRKKKSRRRRNPGLKKKLAFLTHLLRTLDMFVFAELSGLYYMECSMFRFLLRAMGQMMYLTPKDESFPIPMPSTRMHVLAILIPNLLCALLHLFGSMPVGPDHHRGYQHGGLIIDFVGQKPATWRIYYLLVDLTITFLQCLMMSLHTDREKLRVALKTFRPISPDVARELDTAQTMEALDAEERGILRDTTFTVVNEINETNETELRPLPSSTAAEGIQPSEEGETTQQETSDDASSTHLNDLLVSGNAIIGEYKITQALRTAFSDRESGAATSLRSIGYEATLAALQARRRTVMANPRPSAPNR